MGIQSRKTVAGEKENTDPFAIHTIKALFNKASLFQVRQAVTSIHIRASVSVEYDNDQSLHESPKSIDTLNFI